MASGSVSKVALELSEVYKSYGSVRALADLSFSVEEGSFFAIFGPSSVGKTTTLRAISGLVQPDKGIISIGGANVAHAPIRGRGVSMVFQSFALYPHLTVYRNLAYPLVEEGVGRVEIDSRVRETAEMLRLGHRLDRKPATLSGGEQQRVALGRSLIRRPKLLLLDEPLTNLDAKLRHDTRAEFKRLHRELRDTTILYATPDQIEALSMGHRIGVLRGGRIVQIGDPRNLYLEPNDDFVAALVGDPPINLVPATLKEAMGRRVLELPFLEIDAAPWKSSLAAFPAGSKLTVGVRPQAMTPVSDPAWVDGLRFPARVFLTEPLGDVTILDIVAGSGHRLKMVLPQERAYGIDVDASIDCALSLQELCLFAQETGTAIRRSGAS